MIRIDPNALASISTFLDETMYSLVDFRLGLEAPIRPNGFPSFEYLERVVNRLDELHQVVFRLLRLGQSVEHQTVLSAIPPAVLEAFEYTGLLEKLDSGQWSTPSLLLVPIEGLLVFVSIPPSYPTRTKPCNVWFDLSSYVVAKAMRRSFQGKHVLDICSGSGIQSLLCTSRGAKSVLGLEINEDAVQLARLNATLNRLDEHVSFRCSDKLSALDGKEQFDFVLCNTPYTPALEEANVPLDMGEIGNRVLFALLDDLFDHLAEQAQGILALWRSIRIEGAILQQHQIDSRFEKKGFSTLAFADCAPDSIDSVFGILKHDIDQRFDAQQAQSSTKSIYDLLHHSTEKVDGFYNQLIMFKKGEFESAREFNVFQLAAAQTQK